MTLFNAASVPLSSKNGTVPDVSGAMLDWFQPMTFTQLVKSVVGFENVEVPTPVNFRGVIQPLTGRRLELKPEGQRAWTWQLLHADPVLNLEVDEVVVYQGIQTRVMAKKDYSLYGFIEYEIVQDFSGSGPGL